MGLWTLFLLALGLSMDAFAVSITNGLCYGEEAKKYSLYTALAFGLAQGIMPVIGFFAGITFSKQIESLDHWIALILLGAIGGKMIFEAIKEMKLPPEEVCKTQFSMKLLVVQAIATSVDALAVGISFALMSVNIVVAAGFIGIVTFFCCLVGVSIGKRFGLLLKHRAEIFGGIILICIGLKIFIEHSSTMF